MIYTTLYLDYIKNNRNLSDWTIKGYKGYLRFFDEYLRRITNHRITIEDCEKIQKIHIENFIAEKMRGGKNPRTINIYISAIKGYLNYCENIGKKICNYRLIERLRESPREIEALKENECGILLNYFRDMIKRNPGKELLYKRNYCICYMLLYLGVRLSELYKLNKKDIKESLLVKGKGRKNRILTLFNEDLEVIKDYLCLRKDDNEALFISLSPTSYGNRLSRNTIENVIKEGGEGIGIHLFPHKLRHTFATNLLRNNAKLPHIQKLLGHSSLDTTQIYLTVLDDELKETQKLLQRF